MSSPTARSLKLLRDAGFLAQVVERWNPHARRRIDLFGFIDILAIKGDTIIAVQTTTASNMAARIAKMRELETVVHWLDCDMPCPGRHRTIHVHGWSKRGPRGRRKTWQCKIMEVSRFLDWDITSGFLSLNATNQT